MEREELEQIYGQVWNTQEVQEDFIIESFAASCVLVKRKNTDTRGTLLFQHNPRYYYTFMEELI